MSGGSEQGLGRRKRALTPAGTERAQQQSGQLAGGRAPKINFASFTIGERPVLGTHTSFINKTVSFMVNRREEETTGAKDE